MRTKTVEGFNVLMAIWSSSIEKSIVEMSWTSEILFIGNKFFSGVFGALPIRFLKWSCQLDILFLADPPLMRVGGLELFPDNSPTVFQAAWCLLHHASDWCLLSNIVSQLKFPSHISENISNRPDIVIFSDIGKILIFIELTSPCEENFEERHKLKFNRYRPNSDIFRAC